MNTKLARVTLTGADDTVDQQDLLEISARFPFVEWGILIGSSHGHRFPSEAWMINLMNVVRDVKTKPQLSLHICGHHLRRIAAGKPLQLPSGLLKIFQRCQLNWHAEPKGDIAQNIVQTFDGMLSTWGPQVIFQLDGKNNGLIVECGAKGMTNVAGLYDLSHGAGILPEEWPKNDVSGDSDFKKDTGFSDFQIGCAGGLGPDNLREELPKIHAAAAGEYWIDMETKLYDGLQFSLENCVEVLDIAAQFMAEGAQ